MSRIALEQSWVSDPYAQPRSSGLTFAACVHYVALVPMILAFISLAESDTMETGLTASRVIELGFLAIGCSIIGITALLKPAWKIRLDRPTLGIMTVFCTLALASAAWSPLRFLSVGKAVELGSLSVGAALAGAWASVYAPSRKQMATILALALFTAILLLLCANVLIHGTPIPMTGDGVGDTGRPRLIFGTAHPLVAADLIALTIIMVVACRLHIVFKIIMLMFLTGLFYLTQPRGAAAGVFSAMVAMTMFKIRRADVRIILITMSALLAAAIVLYLGPDLIRIANHVTPDDADTLNGRTELWRYAIYLISKKPLLGYGYYASRFLLLDLFAWAGHCHNAYLEVALSLGVLGIAVMAALTVRIIRVCLATKDLALIGVACYCYCVSMLDPLLLTPGAPMVVLSVLLMTAGATEPVRSTVEERGAWSHARALLVHNHYQQAGGEDQVFAAEGKLLESFGHEVVRFEMDNHAIGAGGSISVACKTVWNRGVYRELRELIRKHRPQVMHVHNTFPLISPAAYYAAQKESVAVVQTLHNYRLLCPAATMYRDGKICESCVDRRIPWPGVVHACYRSSRSASAATAAMLTAHRAMGTWRRAIDRYIALTDFAKAKFVGAGFSADQIAVKPNFLHTDPQPGEGAGNYAVFVGRLTPEKGIATLLAAWKTLARIIPLKIVGDGPLAGDVAEAAKHEGIEWLGRRTPEETLAIIGNAALLVFPSEWYETFGLVAIEAFAKGTPVVASNLGAMAELVRPGSNGALFEAGNPEDLVATVQRVLADADNLRQMRVKARQEYEVKYTAAINHRMIQEIYQSAIASGARHERVAAKLTAVDA